MFCFFPPNRGDVMLRGIISVVASILMNRLSHVSVLGVEPIIVMRTNTGQYSNAENGLKCGNITLLDAHTIK